jgi:hypothetical protein
VARRGGAATREDLRFFLEVQRDDIVAGTFRALQKFDDQSLLKRLAVVFQGEQGQDEGGISQEFFYLFCNAAFSPEYGLFRKAAGGKYWFRSDPAHPVHYFSLLGTIVGLAAHNSIILPIRFPMLLYKKMCGQRLLLSDLNEIEEELVTSFRMLQEIRDRGEDVSECQLTFSIDLAEPNNGDRLYRLKDNGDQISVTNDNLDEYITLYSDYLMNVAIARPFTLFKTGFDKIGAHHVLSVFWSDELDIIVSGRDIMNWDELRANTCYIDGYHADSRAVGWFWEVFGGMSDDQKRRLLRFATGTDRTCDVIMTLQKISDTTKLPVAHTCFNILGLPDYPSKAQLQENLLIAIENHEGFGLL